MKLWQKNFKVNKEIEKFTVGNDYLLDYKIIKFDCIASIAHAKMLQKIGLLNEKELSKLVKGLKDIINLHAKGKFKIKQEDEDCHTAIENYLIKKYGKVGKKIHTARSRNDQVLTALRLYEKQELKEIEKQLTQFKKSLSCLIEKQGQVQIPGYTHMQKAMPTNIKTWLGCFVASCEDNLKVLDATFNLIDQSPLGSAAGFGVPVFEVDKKMTADIMGFSKVMENPIYAQMSRGKFESAIVHALSQVMFDLNKLSTDLIMFSMKEFGFISLPPEFCTGSSVMPQKKNPDVLELIRAEYYLVLGEEFRIKSMIGNLMSGYNRDIQLTKEPLIKTFETVKNCLRIMGLIIPKIKINEEKCKESMSKELFATQETYELVKKGVPFREAYKSVGKKY